MVRASQFKKGKDSKPPKKVELVDVPVPVCSFCVKRQDEVELLVEGAAAHICSECIELCGRLLEERRAQKRKKLNAQG